MLLYDSFLWNKIKKLKEKIVAKKRLYGKLQNFGDEERWKDYSPTEAETPRFGTKS